MRKSSFLVGSITFVSLLSSLNTFCALAQAIIVSPSTTAAEIQQRQIEDHTALDHLLQKVGDLIFPSVNLSQKADKELSEGNWQKAQETYQAAIDSWPDNAQALYGLGRCSDHFGDTQGAIAYYRRNIYAKDPKQTYGLTPGDGYGTNDMDRLLQYAALLNKAGIKDEAVTIYDRGAYFYNHEDGGPTPDVRIPLFGNGPHQIVYSQSMVKAMIDIGLSRNEQDYGMKGQEVQEATVLAPNSAVAWYYLGEYQMTQDRPGKPAPYQKTLQKAVSLDPTGEVAQKIKDYLM